MVAFLCRLTSLIIKFSNHESRGIDVRLFAASGAATGSRAVFTVPVILQQVECSSGRFTYHTSFASTRPVLRVRSSHVEIP